MRRLLALVMLALLLAPLPVVEARALEVSPPVVLRAAAVAETPEGLVGTTADVTVTAATNGSGHIFLDTFPLAEVDMQGSTRLAVRVASQTTGVSWREHDFFFVVRSNAPLIGGPSAGAALAVGAAAAMSGWQVREDVLMTGTIGPDGGIGPVGGVPEKARAARDIGMRLFLFPGGQDFVLMGERAVNLTQYCARELGIECRPVFDLIDAINVMTDHRIERAPVPENVTDERYRALLAPLGQELVDAARARLAEAEEAVAGVPAAQRAPWTPRLENARSLMARAESAYDNGTFYTAASLSFQASNQSQTVRDGVRVLSAADVPGALAEVVAAAAAEVARAAREVEAAPVRDAAAFERVGSAQVRLQDAEARLAQARELAAGPLDVATVVQAVHDASWASQRSFTARWWLRLAEEGAPGEPVEEAQLARTARETLSASREAVTYIDSVLSRQYGMPVVTGAMARVEEAERAMERGFYSAAILHALEAEVRASSVLETVSHAGEVPEAKLELVRENAARAIEAARARGVEPLLAQSQYEFGVTLEDPVERLSYLGVARVTANLAGLPDLLAASVPVETRFQGVPAFPGAPPVWVPAAFAVGLALGVGLGFTALMAKRDEDEQAEGEEAEAAPPLFVREDVAPPGEAGAEEDAGAPPNSP